VPEPVFDIVLPRVDEFPDIEFVPLIVEEFDEYELDVDDELDMPLVEFELPIELPLVIEFIELALLAPLVLYAFVELFEVLVHDISTAVNAVSNPKAMIFFILDRFSSKIWFHLTEIYRTRDPPIAVPNTLRCRVYDLPRSFKASIQLATVTSEQYSSRQTRTGAVFSQ
jgi:hypothetical protein